MRDRVEELLTLYKKLTPHNQIRMRSLAYALVEKKLTPEENAIFLNKGNLPVGEWNKQVWNLADRLIEVERG